MSLTRIAGIQGVTIKQTQRGDLYQVTTTDGTEYATFNGGLANQARSLIGQNVELTYSEKQNGQWTNRYYEGAQPAQGGYPAQQSQTFAQPAQQATSFGSTPAGNADPDRELKIMRQTATKVAAQMLGFLPPAEQTPTGLLTVADFLVDYYKHGYLNAQQQAQPAQQAFPTDDIPF